MRMRRLLLLVLLALPGLTGCGLKSVTPSEPLRPWLLGRLELSLPATFLPEPRRSAYSWHGGRTFFMEQPYEDAADKRAGETGLLGEILAIERTPNGIGGDLSTLCGCPARYIGIISEDFPASTFDRDFWKPGRIYVLARKDDVLLDIIQDDCAGESRALLAGDFTPMPAPGVEEAWRKSAMLAQSWNSSHTNVEERFHTLLGSVEAPSEKELPEESSGEVGIFSFVEEGTDIVCTIRTWVSEVSSNGGESERRAREEQTSGMGGNGSPFYAMCYVLLHPSQLPELLADGTSDRVQERWSVRKRNDMYGFEDVSWYKEGDAFTLFAEWEHFGVKGNRYHPGIKISLRGTTGHPERFMGIWDALLSSLRLLNPTRNEEGTEESFLGDMRTFINGDYGEFYEDEWFRKGKREAWRGFVFPQPRSRYGIL